MAKGQGGGEDRTKIKFRFFEVEVEGASGSVENSINRLAQVLAARGATRFSSWPCAMK